MLDRLHDGVDVELVAEVHELLAQSRDMDRRRDVDGHLHGEHRRAGVRRGIAARGDFADFDFASREEAAQAVHDAGLVEQRFNLRFLTAGDSREPEQAGVAGAVMGSFLTLVVTLLLSFPIGVAAAIYLEEFAPAGRLTDFIEVNINNLAAVPSIVFGLLGLAVFIQFFGVPRSAPLVGGLVLTLMTLPTIIIASRAAIKSAVKWNMYHEARAALPATLRERLAQRFRPAVIRLQDLLGRDLTHWHEPVSTREKRPAA